MFEPSNEQGTILMFSLGAESAGWKITEIRTAYPDAVLERNGEKWRVEFEYKASSFITHKHDTRECDLIICWENDYDDCPLPIIELKNKQWRSENPVKCEQWRKEVEYWKQRATLAERQLNAIRNRIKSDRRQDRLDAGEELTTESALLKTEQRLNTLIDTLLNTGWHGVKPLADALKVSRTTVYKDLDTLVARGLLRIVRDADEKIVDVVVIQISMEIPHAVIHVNGKA